MRSDSTRLLHRGLLLATLAALVTACGSGGTGPDVTADSAKPKGDPEVNQAIQERLSEIVNEAELRYKPVQYEYEEGLLKIADQAEAALSGKSTATPTRFMPKLDEPEERDHFRETIKRWEEQNGQTFRAAIDPLVAEVAARKPGQPIDPGFHKRFAAVFDSFVPIEVKEARERQNRAIHTQAEILFATHRAAQPALVKEFEESLKQQYPLPAPTAKKPGS